MSRGAAGAAVADAAVVDTIVSLRGISTNLSQLVAALRGMTINNVLDAEVAVIPATGVWSRDFSVPFASVAISSAAAVTVAADAPQASAPAAGPASQVIVGGAVLNISGRTLSVYGAAGTQISVQVFDRPQPPSYSPAATITTAASAQVLTPAAEDSTLLLAAGAVNGATRDTQGLGVARFRAFAAADVAGTLSIEQSRDGLTWYETTSAGILANIAQGTVLESIIALRFVRARVVNGGAGQAAFEFDSTLVAI